MDGESTPEHATLKQALGWRGGTHQAIFLQGVVLPNLNGDNWIGQAYNVYGSGL
jgi:hypothetical protein